MTAMITGMIIKSMVTRGQPPSLCVAATGITFIVVWFPFPMYPFLVTLAIMTTGNCTIVDGALNANVQVPFESVNPVVKEKFPALVEMMT